MIFNSGSNYLANPSKITIFPKSKATFPFTYIYLYLAESTNSLITYPNNIIKKL